jgi:hypothetical protein
MTADQYSTLSKSPRKTQSIGQRVVPSSWKQPPEEAIAEEDEGVEPSRAAAVAAQLDLSPGGATGGSKGKIVYATVEFKGFFLFASVDMAGTCRRFICRHPHVDASYFDALMLTPLLSTPISPFFPLQCSHHAAWLVYQPARFSFLAWHLSSAACGWLCCVVVVWPRV